MASLIYKICAETEWAAAVMAGSFEGSAVDLRDGFIHFSQEHQVDATWKKHFAGQRDLVRIGVDPTALGAALRYEVSRGGELFPHLYGPLDASLAREVVVITAVTARIRVSRSEDDAVMARHFCRMWLDNGVAPERLRADSQERVESFVTAARRDAAYRGFIAEVDGSGVVGSAACQLFAGLYPDILVPEQRRYGYLWGVYVEPEQRRLGMARQLTGAALEYLRSIGCTQVRLHASPSGRSIYTELGFASTNEMSVELTR